jgi:pSer/pThr/pTyr-binding forkhead associated (FHA) protein
MSTERWTEDARLIGQAGALQGGRWLLNGEMLLIGRGPECDVVVPDRQVSRHHARVRRMAEGEFQLEDLGSKNGTHVNGVALQRRAADRWGRDPSRLAAKVAVRRI